MILQLLLKARTFTVGHCGIKGSEIHVSVSVIRSKGQCTSGHFGFRLQCSRLPVLWLLLFMKVYINLLYILYLILIVILNKTFVRLFLIVVTISHHQLKSSWECIFVFLILLCTPAVIKCCM